MPIAFTPNDPRASTFKAPRTQPESPDRDPAHAGFDYGQPAPAGVHAPGTPGFLYWQTRESALRAMAAFEEVRGAPLKAWARSASPKKLLIEPDAGEELNAYYDGDSLRFFHYPVGKSVIHSGASTDVVAHEVGHALLDAL